MNRKEEEDGSSVFFQECKTESSHTKRCPKRSYRPRLMNSRLRHRRITTSLKDDPWDRFSAASFKERGDARYPHLSERVNVHSVHSQKFVLVFLLFSLIVVLNMAYKPIKEYFLPRRTVLPGLKPLLLVFLIRIRRTIEIILTWILKTLYHPI